MDVKITKTREFDADVLAELFHSVGWEEDTPPSVLKGAMRRATRVVAAYDGDKLVGLIRSMDDGLWSANIDCLVVHIDYWGKGVGTKQITTLLAELKDVVTISVSPNECENASFYERFGFGLVKDGRLLQRVKGAPFCVT